MGNKKPPKKAPPNSKIQKPGRSISHVSEQPTEALRMAEKDIGKQGTSSEPPPATLIGSPLSVASATQEVEKENRTGPVCVEDGGSSGEKPSEVATPAQNIAIVEREEVPKSQTSWAELVKGSSKQLKKKGNAFKLESGEACIRIPNSVIDRHKKAWDCFILGQFYANPPSHGTIHNIVNGIWSKQYRDIAVSKMGDQAFLFRIPNASTRQRVLTQRLWQIEGRTMFVAKWEPGISQEKPELTSAPIWLELRDVPLQFFNEEGLEHIASLVGEPKFLHPTTENKSNLEVAKVFTVIDPREALPEAVNVQYESGEIRRIRVSSPWMPPVCSFCNDIGHGLRHCLVAPKTCSICDSTVHLADICPKRRSRTTSLKPRAEGKDLDNPQEQATTQATPQGKGLSRHEWIVNSQVQVPEMGVKQVDKGKGLAVDVKDTKPKKREPRPMEKLILGGMSARTVRKHGSPRVATDSSSSDTSGSSISRDEDTSDRYTSDPEEGEYQKVISQRQRKALRGKGLKNNL